MWQPLTPGSSPIDWCEGNYLISSQIAEFVNTLSNFLFLLLPPLLMHLFRGYARLISPAINVLWALLMVVGASSAYFHATLSLIGQLLDELAILWVFIAAFSLFLPKRYFPTFLSNNRKTLSLLAAMFAVLATGFALAYPAVNAFALMFLGIPSVILLITEIKRCQSQRVARLGFRCAVIWVCAVTCWLNDRLLCDTWSAIHFPYLHALWHVLIFISSYTCLVLFAYFHAQYERPQAKVHLRYWPKDEFEFGVPFVYVFDPSFAQNNYLDDDGDDIFQKEKYHQI